MQVCNLVWSKNVNELVSTHGYSQNQIIVWRYPSMSKVTEILLLLLAVLKLSSCGILALSSCPLLFDFAVGNPYRAHVPGSLSSNFT